MLTAGLGTHRLFTKDKRAAKKEGGDQEVEHPRKRPGQEIRRHGTTEPQGLGKRGTKGKDQRE